MPDMQEVREKPGNCLSKNERVLVALDSFDAPATAQQVLSRTSRKQSYTHHQVAQILHVHPVVQVHGDAQPYRFSIKEDPDA